MGTIAASIPGAGQTVRFVEPGEAEQPKPKPSEALANQDVFMRLLIAQLKYQNPMAPADGAEYIAQLTQFSQLEQATKSQQELAAIRQLLESMSAAARARASGAGVEDGY